MLAHLDTPFIFFVGMTTEEVRAKADEFSAAGNSVGVDACLSELARRYSEAHAAKQSPRGK